MEFSIDPNSLERFGRGLSRPECVLATARGDVFAADFRGGVSHLKPDGSQALYLGELPGGRPLRPNGIALCADGSFLLADLGEELGGIFQLTRGGQVRPVVEQVDGVALPPCNFVTQDTAGRTWLTVSTRLRPRTAAYRHDVADGFIVVCDTRGARIVADSLGYTNEAHVSPDGRYLYVNETFARRLSRFPIYANAELGARETVCVFGAGTFPDGLMFDAEGGVWITSIISNRIVRVAPDGSQQVVFEDANSQALNDAEAAFAEGTLGLEHVARAVGATVKNISSLAFGGPDLRTAYLGCLHDDCIYRFRAPVAGAPLPHFGY